MANLDENTGAGAYNWDEDGIYQLEVTDPVQAGAGGISNRQATELAVRTRNLHTRLLAAAQSIVDLIGTADADHNTLGKLQAAIEALDFSQVNLDELKAELRGTVDASLDTMQEIVEYIQGLSYLPEFQGRAKLTTNTIDWTGKPERFKTLTDDLVVDASNLVVGKTIGLRVDGAFNLTFAAKFKKIPGTPNYAQGSVNYVQMKCLNDTVGSEEILYFITPY